MKLPLGWSPDMVASAFKESATGMRRAALDLEIFHIRPDLSASLRKEARNLMARRRRLLKGANK